MGFFNKTKTIVSPATGKVILVSDVGDNVFSEKVLGDGIAVIPEENEIVSPCDGVIMQIAHTKHAICFETQDGLEILLHLGMDTVNLKGEGFECFAREGEKVKAGQKLMEMDINFIKSKGFSVESPCIITNMDKLKTSEFFTGNAKRGETTVIKYKV
ncbi:MAG: PTS glucose transporter subunit IIA [Oscillospiraceae bacterium]